MFLNILGFLICLRDHLKSTYALREREWVKVKEYIYCFYDAILSFKDVQGREGGVSKLTNLRVCTLRMVP